MAKTISSMADLQSILENACANAIEAACKRLLEKLQQLIDSEFYNKYTPKYYDPRTYQFRDSAITEMVTNLCGQILMNPDAMHYTEYWTGEIQLQAANKGSHGGWVTTEGRYWDEFIKFFKANAGDILKEELQKRGFHVS